MNGETESWDLIIRPQRGWLDLRLGELWRARDLIMLFVWRDFVSVNKQTILGPLWYVVQPILTTHRLHRGLRPDRQTADRRHAGFPVLHGGQRWSGRYFSQCLMKTSDTFMGNAGLFGKVYFPRLLGADLAADLEPDHVRDSVCSVPGVPGGISCSRAPASIPMGRSCCCRCCC